LARQPTAPRKSDQQRCLFDRGLAAKPVLISACLLRIPCRWHGRRAKKREKLIRRPKEKYVLVRVCPERPLASKRPTPNRISIRR
jgi:hypothetical protein